MLRYNFILIMKHFLPYVLCCLLLMSCGKAADGMLPRAEEPLDSAITAQMDSTFWAVNAVSASDLHSLMVVQHGRVIYEKYGIGHDAEELHVCWSATKTFTALAAGFAIQDGLLNLETPIIEFLPKEELPDSLDARWQQLCLHQVLCMTSGLRSDSITDRTRAGERFSPLATIFERGFRDEPGNRWRYNNCDSYLVARVVENVTGKTVDEYLEDKLFRPLAIHHWEWEKDATGHCPGGFGLHITTESLAKMGLFILQEGQWEGKQLLNREWLQAMTAVHSWQDPDNIPSEEQRSMSYELGASDWRSGYCYQMWACRAPGATRADGMWGQYVIVMPDKDAVGVMTTICTDRSAQMNAFWKNVYEKLK